MDDDADAAPVGAAAAARAAAKALAELRSNRVAARNARRRRVTAALRQIELPRSRRDTAVALLLAEDSGSEEVCGHYVQEEFDALGRACSHPEAVGRDAFLVAAEYCRVVNINSLIFDIILL